MLFQTFPNHPELLRNMMGLLGNVAEVGDLRPQLMTSEFVIVFSELLYSTSDGIEVHYNFLNLLFIVIITYKLVMLGKLQRGWCSCSHHVRRTRLLEDQRA